MRKYISLAIFFIVLGCLLIGFIESRAASMVSANDVGAALSQLEDRFFEHRYESEPDSDRLNRLEEFVFGSDKTGSTNERVKRLLSTIPEEENSQTNSTPTNDSNINEPQNSSVENGQAQTSSVAPNPAFNYGSYPRVANLEQELLGHTYTDDSLPDRIKRLETKAYGAPSSSTDFCQRVDLLDDYAQRHDLYGDHKALNNPQIVQTFNSTTPINTSPAFGVDGSRHKEPWMDTPARQTEFTSSNGSFIGSAEERVSMMEAQVFNHTYPDKPLDLRLKKLGKKILPNENIAELSETAQTVKLWNTLHPSEANQVAVLADNDTGSGTNSHSQRRGSWLHLLATAGTSMGPNSSMPAAYGTNAGYIPGMFPSNSHFVGASVGPGTGPAGLPIGFW